MQLYRLVELIELDGGIEYEQHIGVYSSLTCVCVVLKVLAKHLTNKGEYYELNNGTVVYRIYLSLLNETE